MESSDLVGFIAGALGIICFIPQVIKTWKTKSTKDISFLMFLLFCISVAFWIVYGILTQSKPIIIANITVLALASSILFLKIKYK